MDRNEFEIREETPADYNAIDEVTRLAFGGDDEVRLIRNLRRDGDMLLSLVANSRSTVIGHIAFSRMLIDTRSEQVRAVALAPLAVRPQFQRSGVGSALIEDGLKRLEKDEAILLVLGHPEYYVRFGFSPDLARPVLNPFDTPAAWMALELRPRALADLLGRAKYAKAFGLPSEWTME